MKNLAEMAKEIEERNKKEEREIELTEFEYSMIRILVSMG